MGLISKYKDVVSLGEYWELGVFPLDREILELVDSGEYGSTTRSTE
jgi:hypothetical protein